MKFFSATTMAIAVALLAANGQSCAGTNARSLSQNLLTNGQFSISPTATVDGVWEASIDGTATIVYQQNVNLRDSPGLGALQMVVNASGDRAALASGCIVLLRLRFGGADLWGLTDLAQGFFGAIYGEGTAGTRTRVNTQFIAGSELSDLRLAKFLGQLTGWFFVRLKGAVGLVADQSISTQFFRRVKRSICVAYQRSGV